MQSAKILQFQAEEENMTQAQTINTSNVSAINTIATDTETNISESGKTSATSETTATSGSTVVTTTSSAVVCQAQTSLSTSTVTTPSRANFAPGGGSMTTSTPTPISNWPPNRPNLNDLQNILDATNGNMNDLMGLRQQEDLNNRYKDATLLALDRITANLATTTQGIANIGRQQIERLKVTRSLHNSTIINGNPVPQTNDLVVNNAPGISNGGQTSTGNDTNLMNASNLTITDVRKSIELNNSTKLNIKRDYKLTSKFDMGIWMDYLKSELKTYDLLDVIDPDVTPTRTFAPNLLQKRMDIVRDIIIHRIDHDFHKRIINYQKPLEIINKLRELKRIESNVANY